MAKILYHAVPVPWRKEEKYAFLERAGSVAGVKWKVLKPDKKQNWLDLGYREEFDDFIALAHKEAAVSPGEPAVFTALSLGVKTNRDEWAFDFRSKSLAEKMERTIQFYGSQLHEWHSRKNRKPKLDVVLNNDPTKISWSETLKKKLERGVKTEFEAGNIRPALYRPFTKQYVYFDADWTERRYQQPFFFPKTNSQNSVIVVSDIGMRSPFSVMATDQICDIHLCASSDAFQCFPLFTYSEDGKERRDNITPKALTLFQIFYDDDGITRADIFHYVYALLHHPAYRTRYAENLKRELPRIPFVGVGTARCAVRARKAGAMIPAALTPGTSQRDVPTFYPLAAVEKMQGDAKPDHDPKASAKLFHAFAAAGQKLADLHVNYESAKEFPLQRQENKAVKLDWRVEAMKLIKVGMRSTASQTSAKKKIGDAVESVPTDSIIYNDFLTLSGIPAEVYDYRLGNRSALEWVIDQYRVTKDDNGNIVSDPNRLDDEQYILRLIGQVITVSLETVKVVKSLPALGSSGSVAS